MFVYTGNWTELQVSNNVLKDLSPPIHSHLCSTLLSSPTQFVCLTLWLLVNVNQGEILARDQESGRRDVRKWLSLLPYGFVRNSVFCNLEASTL